MESSDRVGWLAHGVQLTSDLKALQDGQHATVVRSIRPAEDGGVEIEVWLDRAGRDYLVRELGKLSDSNEHFHLFSRTWFFSGSQLTEERRNAGSSIGRHVKFYLRPEREALPAADKSN